MATDNHVIAVGLRSLRHHFPAVATAVSALDALKELEPAEGRCMTGMKHARRYEFAAGRSAARRALCGAGHPGGVIVAGADGLPVFPAGYLGSISHKHGWAIAAAALVTTAAGVGIDLEFDEGQPDADLQAEVVLPSEEHFLDGVCTADPGITSPETLVLSAKEAIYKAVFPLRRVRFDFDDLQLALDPKDRSFQAVRFPADEGILVGGRYTVAGRWIICLATANT